LLKNIKRTEERGVEKSCTIKIGSTMRDGGKRVCVVDGGVWKGCDVSPSPKLVREADGLVGWAYSGGFREGNRGGVGEPPICGRYNLDADDVSSGKLDGTHRGPKADISDGTDVLSP